MDVTEFLQNIGELPTLPSVAGRINAESKKESLTAGSLSSIIARDPSLTAKVLRLANSAYYGLARQVGTLDRAVTVLGFNTILNLTLTLSVFKLFRQDNTVTFDIQGLWRHSLGCAVAAKTVAAQCDATVGDKAFLCGIIHDIGKIIIAHNLPAEAARIAALMHDSGISWSAAEKEVLGFTHADAGALLSDKWNFPQEYSRAIRLHHSRLSPENTGDGADAVLIHAVAAGNQLAKALSLGTSIDPHIGEISPPTLKVLGISTETMEELKAAIAAEFEKIADSWVLG